MYNHWLIDTLKDFMIKKVKILLNLEFSQIKWLPIVRYGNYYHKSLPLILIVYSEPDVIIYLLII